MEQQRDLEFGWKVAETTSKTISACLSDKRVLVVPVRIALLFGRVVTQLSSESYGVILILVSSESCLPHCE